MDYGSRFRAYRKRQKLSQKEAAKLIGVKSYQLANYETNRSEPSIRVLKDMSKVYHVTIDRLVNNIVVGPTSLREQELERERQESLKELEEILARLKSLSSDNNE